MVFMHSLLHFGAFVAYSV